MVYKICLLAFVGVVMVGNVSGHGMMLDPPNRSSLWRFDTDAPINYNDNENFCGGFGVQWGVHKGKCGVCGDNYADAHPQANENTGKFGGGKIVANYTAGQIIEVQARLTANHLGRFEYDLCEILDDSAVESGENCFQPLLLADGTPTFKITAKDFDVVNKVQLPKGFSCRHCVLRWQYVTGNNWGVCEDGSGNLGCGPQETFRSCSDIRIY